MLYDYIIAGSGIAGSVCAYELSKKGKKCLILEKRADVHEKVCGGGISYKGIKLLNDIGIDVIEELGEQASKVTGHIIYTSKEVREKSYSLDQISLGSKRILLDSLLLKHAINSGAEILYNQPVKKICYSDGIFNINSFVSKRFVSAVGARGLYGIIPHSQSVGISAHITGTTELRTDRFHYWYYTESDDRYFWIFPIGKNLWNIGLWYRKAESTMKCDFDRCVSKIVSHYFVNGYDWVILPKGEFLGNTDLRCQNNISCDGIGDFAGLNNKLNGGGIIQAIQSAIEYSKSVY